MLDDIGRVVIRNDYNTEGIMAGYNAAKITDKQLLIKERISNITKND